MSLPVYFAFLLACAVVMIGPSPALTLIVAGRLRHGRMGKHCTRGRQRRSDA
jgi:threonine/homoserine/homoserine lactone efflux protein